jgi:uncharacterized protein (TIGR02646 family)
MIYADRSSSRGPDIAWLAKAEQRRARTAHLIARPEAGVELRWDAVLLRELRPLLTELFASKCAYCESPLGVTDTSQAELFRPRAMAINFDGETTRPGYWWLAYAWENLYLACAECNRNKGNRFPVAGSRALRPDDDLATEHALLLDPCADDPEEHLLFNEDGLAASASTIDANGHDRGAITIDVLGLNRPGLVEARRQAAAALHARGHVDEAAPYVAMQRQLHGEDAQAKQVKEQVFVYQQAHEEDLRRSSVSDNINREALQTQLIHAIDIVNFRGIDNLRFEFGVGDGERCGWTMLLGENGVGKSSVLQALALALMGVDRELALLEIEPEDLLRRGTTEGHIRLFFSADAEPLEVSLTDTGIEYVGSSARPRMIVLGFGSSRWLPRPGGFEPDRGEFIRVHNLFNPFVPLADTIGWLGRLDSDDFEKTERALLRLLRLDAGEELVRDNGDVLVRAASQPVDEAVSLRQLSDGYQAVIAMVGDIMELLSPKRIAMEAAEGLVLVDEIGSHLHPRWKMQAVARLREAFPKLQFVTTTHEPLCLRGLHDRLDRVIVMRRDSQGRIVLVPDLPSVEALRVDQLLTSPHFGLHSTMDEETEALFNEYYLLLAHPRRTKAQQARIAELREQLDTRDQLGANRRERLMLEAIDNYLAREAQTLRDGGQPLLKQETSERLAAILDETGGLP